MKSLRKNLVSLVSFSLAAASTVPALVACGTNEQDGSRTSGTEIDNTQIKWQSIGNCWIYATLGWVESLHMTATGKQLNLSETYMTYRHWQDSLVGSYEGMTEIQTGGSWWDSQSLITTYGVMAEGDFVAGEAEQTKSATQSRAEAYINDSLQNGKLKNDRSEATVIQELNAAFGVDTAKFSSKIIPASKVVVGYKQTGNRRVAVKLSDEISRWQSTSATSVTADSTVVRRAIKALNARLPVIMTWHVDFNALDNKGVFSMENLEKAGGPGRQGGHMTVIEDYTAEIPATSTSPLQIIGEGLVAPELQLLAEKSGRLTSIIVKNSWGGSDRLDRGSYIHDGSGGFHKLEASYLFGKIKLSEGSGFSKGLKSFILPAGY